MRRRIFSNVLLPAPLRPMMPSTSPRLTSKLTSLSAQNSSTVSPATMARPRAMSAVLRQKLRAPRAKHVAQRDIALALGRMADHVFLAEPLGADHDVAHRSNCSHRIRESRRRERAASCSHGAGCREASYE